VPGKPGRSELLRRVRADDDEVMPPPGAGTRLTADEVATLCRWIDQGAGYTQHWAYVRPVRPEVPAVGDPSWPANPVDRFILARLEHEGLRPAPPADRYALARRVTLDLTGLPPTVADVDAFVQDPAAHAYERLVDRLLASPAYGERWAHVWLDLARYADSQGYANDPDRTIWRWRDWVIGALNADMPFDQFTVEQLAGDLLRRPTTSQLVATGFHRNTLTNTEGGTSPEEFRSAAVVDRVNTTLQVWMGVTIACAQCHNHKYDPFSQKEYYQLYSIFNNCQDANGGDDAPTLVVARVGREDAYAAAATRLAGARQRLESQAKKVDAALPAWAKTVAAASLPKDVAAALAVPAAKRTPQQAEKLRSHHRSLSAAWKTLDAEVRDLDTRAAQLGTSTPVLREGAGDSRSHPRQFPRQGRGRRPRPARRLPAAPEGPAGQPPDAGPLAGRPGQPADGARGRQPAVGRNLWRRRRGDQRELRPAGGAAVSPRAARLAGHGVRPHRLGHQARTPAAGDVGHLPPVVARR
jgi:hypothetical protein